MTQTYDVLVIGGGMAGVSLAHELASDHSVGVVDMESTLAYHTTGRSAAVFAKTLGSSLVRALTVASRDFLLDSSGWFESPAMAPLGSLVVASPEHADMLRTWYDDVVRQVPELVLVGEDEMRVLNRALRPGAFEAGVYEPDAMEMDVHAIHTAYVRGLRGRGGRVHASAGVVSATRASGAWRVTLADGALVEAGVVVDAAGAWADDVAAVFGVGPAGIRPLRRSMFGVRAPDGLDPVGLPMTTDAASRFYFKPEGEGFLCSPAEETAQPPGDARPDQLEIARALDLIHEVTTIDARSVRSPWAGLRSFAADRHPVVGRADDAEGFFWFAGQGGYGIQTAPALARAGGALFRGLGIPDDLSAHGVDGAAMSPSREGLTSGAHDAAATSGAAQQSQD